MLPHFRPSTILIDLEFQWSFRTCPVSKFLILAEFFLIDILANLICHIFCTCVTFNFVYRSKGNWCIVEQKKLLFASNVDSLMVHQRLDPNKNPYGKRAQFFKSATHMNVQLLSRIKYPFHFDYSQKWIEFKSVFAHIWD